MRLSILASLLSILLACRPESPWPNEPSRDENQEAEAALLRRESKSRECGFSSALEDMPSLRVWMRNDAGAQRLLVVWLAPLLTVPGVSRARIVMSDVDQKPLSDETFLTGWRISVASAEKTVSATGQDLLLMRSAAVINGRDVRSQYYAPVGNHLELVRLEGPGDESPSLLQSRYDSPNHTIGPVWPPRDESEVLKALKSGSWARRLSVLAWLGGRHWSGEEAGVVHELPELAERARQLLHDPKIQAAIADLLKAPDVWTREAAGQAHE